jgi:dihydroorotase
MTERYPLIVRRGTCVTPAGIVATDLAVRDGRIAALGDLTRCGADREIDARGLHVLPGVIDSQVHFREPGLEHKEDLATGTASAVMGGVTAVFEMPNTNPPTTSAEALEDKLRRADGRAWCDVAFFAGASDGNTGELAELERSAGCAGIKIFMGSSTGSLLVEDDEALERVLRAGRRRVAVHAEDEPRLRERRGLVRGGSDPGRHPDWRDVETALRATRRLLRLARRAARPVHVLHVSTADELPLLAEHHGLVSVEVTPQHLTLAAPDCYEELGTRAQMNPPIRSAEHREALWKAVAEGLVDVVGSDHAPHTVEEKSGAYPDTPSGIPGVQTLLPLLLDHHHEGRLSLERLADLTSAGPARVYGVAGKGRLAAGYDADLTLVDLGRRKRIEAEWLASRCGWSPFEGRVVRGWPVGTVVRGQPVMLDGERLGEPIGRPVRFL